jgi:hypothetical protein
MDTCGIQIELQVYLQCFVQYGTMLTFLNELSTFKSLSLKFSKIFTTLYVKERKKIQGRRPDIWTGPVWKGTERV